MRHSLANLFFLIFVIAFPAVAQTDVNEVIQGIVDNVGKVELSKVTYDQKLERQSSESVGTLLLSISKISHVNIP